MRQLYQRPAGIDVRTDEIERASTEEKIALAGKMIQKIDVDRDNNAVSFYVRRLPTVAAALEGME